jgi:hypothetical protein
MNFTLYKEGDDDDVSEVLCDWFEANYHAPAKLSCIPYLRYHALNHAWEFSSGLFTDTFTGRLVQMYNVSIEDEYLAVLFALVMDTF